MQPLATAARPWFFRRFMRNHAELLLHFRKAFSYRCVDAPGQSLASGLQGAILSGVFLEQYS